MTPATSAYTRPTVNVEKGRLLTTMRRRRHGRASRVEFRIETARYNGCPRVLLQKCCRQRGHQDFVPGASIILVPADLLTLAAALVAAAAALGPTSPATTPQAVPEVTQERH